MSFLQVLRRPSAGSSIRTWSRGYAATNATASSSAQPQEASKASTSTPQAAAVPISSCVPDTLLKGVNYLKGQSPVLARADEEYPEWLWNVLKPRVYEDDGPGGRKERMERRQANRQAIKDRNFMQTQ
ncbi:hypothetical protein CVT25_009818 [Psilocybe cyanescens]|uniref:Large ribosomal subunit protein mL54 n=1 Tax=Psilocybe cyanescens TaxID=93625 RepID=A0A409X843_PSICY|nr:hypothetical protein CVT25_009818 [Psilocybe cyanescens]